MLELHYCINYCTTRRYCIDLINLVRALKGKEIVLIAVNFNGHVGCNREDYEDQLIVMEVIVMELVARKGMKSGVLCKYEHGSKK